MEIETTEATTKKIYSIIPEDPNAYRYSKILVLEREIKEEILKYDKLLRKYKKVGKVVRSFGYTIHGITFATTSAAISTFAGGITSIIAIPLASIAGLSGLAGMGIDFTKTKLLSKEKKHASTLSLAKVTLSNISRLTAKLIADGKITQEEFDSLMELEKNYYTAKEEIRKKLSKKKLKQAFVKGQQAMKKKILETSQ